MGNLIIFAARFKYLMWRMENLKLISARLVKEDIGRIDSFAKKHSYWKRNAILSQLVHNILSSVDDDVLFDIVRFYGAKKCGFRIKVLIESDNGTTKGYQE